MLWLLGVVVVILIHVWANSGDDGPGPDVSPIGFTGFMDPWP